MLMLRLQERELPQRGTESDLHLKERTLKRESQLQVRRLKSDLHPQDQKQERDRQLQDRRQVRVHHRQVLLRDTEQKR